MCNQSLQATPYPPYLPLSPDFLGLLLMRRNANKDQIKDIDACVTRSIKESGVIEEGLLRIKALGQGMLNEAEQIEGLTLKNAAKRYIDHSSTEFLLMYLLFKRMPSGAI